MRRYLLAFLFTALGLLPCSAASLSQIASALDITNTDATKGGIKLIEQRYVKYAIKLYQEDGDAWYDYEYNTTTWEPIVSVNSNAESNSKWYVQSSGQYSTKACKGTTCLRTSVGSAQATDDALIVSLTVRVYGPGVFTFNYKTSTSEFGDYITVFVDGEEQMLDENSGFYVWEDDDSYSPSVWQNGEIEIPPGMNENGSYYHDITFQFVKDLPRIEYNWDTGKPYYWPDGPEPYDSTDRDDYARYLAQKAIFQNCIWLDNFAWTPSEITLNLDPDPTKYKGFLDFTRDLVIDSDCVDFGYNIAYTTDGSTPTANSPKYYTVNSNGEITEVADLFFDTNGKLKYMLVAGAGQVAPPAAEVKTADIVIYASDPTIKIDSQTADSVIVSMSSDYDKNEIHYTLDGSDPTDSPLIYDPVKKLKLTTACTIRAICQRANVLNSEKMAELVLSGAAEPTNVTVTNSKGETEPFNVYTDNNGMTVSAKAEAGATLEYSLDNGATYTAFTGSFTLKAAGNSTSATALVRASATGKLPSKSLSVTVYHGTDNWEYSQPSASAESTTFIRDGWNLISFPLYLPKKYIDRLLGSFEFKVQDSVKGVYVAATDIVPGQAYWHYQTPGTEPEIPLLQGARSEDAVDFAKGGWRSIGVSQPVAALPAGVDAWEYLDGKYVRVTSLEAGKGYFIHK